MPEPMLSYVNEYGKTIPCLGKTVDEVLNEAFSLNTGGMRLVFNNGREIELTDGEYREIDWRGNTPLIGRKIPDSQIADEISKGWVSIFVQSHGRNPHYRREFHQATCEKIPLGD